MNRILLTRLKIKNFGPIKEDEVYFNDFTFFVGRNNAGKSHYLKAIETLLATKMPSKEEMVLLQNDKTKEVLIEGHFVGVENFTKLASASNHKEAIEQEIKDGVLRVVRVLDPNDEEKTNFGIYKGDGTIHNPRGFTTNLLGVLPDFISIWATADTIDELKNTQNTALGKLKKEALTAFFDELRVKTKKALTTIDSFLHGQTEGERSQELTDFENSLKEELMGEFSEVIPSVEFGLPDERVITNAMKILLDDGYKTEVEQKGHGLQRATLLALLRLLAKSGKKYEDHPAPIFLIGELESFLHPFAQRQMADALVQMMERYQIITTTHSPFIVTPATIEGYRRVRKNKEEGSKSVALDTSKIDTDLIKRHLERRGNLEGLFADRVILIEGNHDENFYERLRTIFNISLPKGKFTLFIKTDGRKQLRLARKFYQQMCFDDISAICDLDYLFSHDIEYLFEELGLDKDFPKEFRKHIGWQNDRDPKLDYILEKLNEKGEPSGFNDTIKSLQDKRVFVLRHGAPEIYYKNNKGEKRGWTNIESEKDLLEVEYLKNLIKSVLI
jgi:predicted ATP-dependent endonuclease of OLD family